MLWWTIESATTTWQTRRRVQQSGQAKRLTRNKIGGVELIHTGQPRHNHPGVTLRRQPTRYPPQGLPGLDHMNTRRLAAPTRRGQRGHPRERQDQTEDSRDEDDQDRPTPPGQPQWRLSRPLHHTLLQPPRSQTTNIRSIELPIEFLPHDPDGIATTRSNRRLRNSVTAVTVVPMRCRL